MTERITINDIRKSGYCVKGARTWFKKHDLDFRSFLKHGIDAKTLLETGDGAAIKVVNEARARRTKKDGR